MERGEDRGDVLRRGRYLLKAGWRCPHQFPYPSSPSMKACHCSLMG